MVSEIVENWRTSVNMAVSSFFSPPSLSLSGSAISSLITSVDR